MRHLLLVFAAGSLLAAADSTDAITIDGLPESVRNQLPQTINGGVVVDIQVDRHNGEPQYLVHYHGQSATEVQTIRLGSNGMVLDNRLIATPEHPNGTATTPVMPNPQPLPTAPGADPTLPGPHPLGNQALGNPAPGKQSTPAPGATGSTTIPLPPGATTAPNTSPTLRPPERPAFEGDQGDTSTNHPPTVTLPAAGQTAPPAQQPGANNQNGAGGSSGAHSK